jgi:DNA recombination protein RmuC
MKHVTDIADKYLIPGETQDTALMFVPSESGLCRDSRWF